MLGVASPVRRQCHRHPKWVQWSPLVMWALLLSSHLSHSTSSSQGGSGLILKVLMHLMSSLPRRPTSAAASAWQF